MAAAKRSRRDIRVATVTGRGQGPLRFRFDDTGDGDDGCLTTAVESDVVELVWARPVEDERLVAMLDAGERSRLGRFVRPEDRARFVAAHALLRIVVGRVLDLAPASVPLTARCATCGGAHGRPLITMTTRPVPHLSLSHAGERVVVAVRTGGPVGVDVEAEATTDFAGFARMALGGHEQTQLAALPAGHRASARARWWVRKEAVLKATGHGLAIPPPRLTVSAPAAPPRLLAWDADVAVPAPLDRFHLSDHDVGAGYALSVAAIGPLAPVVRVVAGDALLRRD